MKKNKLKYIIFTLAMFFTGTIMVYAKNEYLNCGGNYIPAPVAPITRTIVLILQIILPIVLIVMGSLDLLKAVSASNADNIKKSQSQFFKRIISAIIFFFVFTLFKFIINIAADGKEANNMVQCIDCLISDKTKCNDVTTDSPFFVKDKKDETK